MRVVLGISYRGEAYCGFQIQDDYPTVQGELEKAIEVIANHPVKTTCAGRTDKGVHAFLQVIHFDTEANRDEAHWVRGVNAHLPSDIRVRWAQVVTDDFHARFSAYSRSYVYVLNTSEEDLFIEPYAWSVRQIDLDAMRKAGEYILGEHDFHAFQSKYCQAEHAIRRVTELRFETRGHYIYCHITANAFVHHMVRKLIATLVAIGQGKLQPKVMAELLAKPCRASVPGQAPAKGLFLKAIGYDEKFGIPSKLGSQLLGELDV